MCSIVLSFNIQLKARLRRSNIDKCLHLWMRNWQIPGGKVTVHVNLGSISKKQNILKWHMITGYKQNWKYILILQKGNLWMVSLSIKHFSRHSVLLILYVVAVTATVLKPHLWLKRCWVNFARGNLVSSTWRKTSEHRSNVCCESKSIWNLVPMSDRESRARLF